MKKEEIIKAYNMQPHPEGGFFAETYRSEMKIETPNGLRSASTAIYFLITKDSISHFHRLSSDEAWHFYQGEPLRLLEITPNGELIETIMGGDIKAGQKSQYIVPAGNWFASTSMGEFSFVGCTVSPGFEYEDFKMGKFNQMSKDFPQFTELLREFCLD